MRSNYIKTAFRNLIKNRVFTLINLFGLSVGLASCTILVLFVYDQSTYDQFFEEGEHVYRLIERRLSPEGTEINSDVPYSFLGPITAGYPEVKHATAIAGPYSNQVVSVLNQEGQKINFLERQVLLADSNFFKVFSFKMIHGDRNQALRDPNSVVLTESTARRFFGSTNVVGKSILVSTKNSIVTGVCQDPPEKSHFAFSYIVSSTSVKWFNQRHFNLRYAKCYVKLHPDAKPEGLEKKFPDLVNTHLAGEIERVNKVSWKAYQEAGNGYQYFLKPLKSIHLDPEIEGGMKAGTNPVLLKVLLAVAFLILMVAFINFTNLTTAQSLARTREIGVRKVMGSSRHQLILQFLTESFIISFTGAFLAAVLSFTFIPVFNSLFDVSIQFPASWFGSIGLLLISILLSVLVGIYPALMLTRVKPIDSLKGKQVFDTPKTKFRYVLTGFQFWISILLLICTVVFQRQVQFMETRNLGFDQDQILVLKGTFHLDANYTQPFLEEAQLIPGIKGIAGTLWALGFSGTWSDEYTLEHSSTVHQMRRVPIGDGLAEVLGFELVEGALFSASMDDGEYVLLNQAAVKAFDIKDPVGKSIYRLTHDEGSLEKTRFRIKGILKDFNYQSLRSEVEPLVLQSNETVHGRMSYIMVKLDRSNIRKTIERLEDKWEELVPDRAFNYSFLDETLDFNYKSERNLTAIFSLFSGLSLIIVAIGLLGLAAYTCSLRKKEIGIRKIVGASVNNLLILLSKDFLKIFVVAFLMAIPLGWYAMQNWLANFAYRILITADVFALAGVISILITSIAVISQAAKVAVSNPVDSLRSD